MIYGRICGKAMLGGTAKSGKYRYYHCYSCSRVDNDICSCKPINTDRIEDKIIDQLQKHVLTENNLSELLTLTNKELQKHNRDIDAGIDSLSRQLSKNEAKLDKLYSTIESGSFTYDDLAPRLRKLKSDVDALRLKLNELHLNREKYSEKVSINRSQLKAYVSDLQLLLLKGKFFERKNLIKSFINRIEYEYPQVVVHYTFPLNNKKELREKFLL